MFLVSTMMYSSFLACLKLFKGYWELGVIEHAFHPRPWETEAVGSL